MHGYLRHLANFAEVVRAGSITGAAAQLNVSPSVISNSVRILESHYSEPLLERRRDGVRTTPRGTAVSEEANTIVDALHRAMEDPSQSAPKGAVRLALPAEAVAWLKKGFRELQESHPDITLHLHVDDRLEDHTRFARDLYLRVGSMKNYADLHSIYAQDTEVVWVGRPDVVAGLDHNDPQQIAHLPQLMSKSTGPLTADAAATRLDLARSGFGLTGCLKHTVEDDLATGRLVRCMPAEINKPVWIVLGTPHKRPAARTKIVALALQRALARGKPG